MAPLTIIRPSAMRIGMRVFADGRTWKIKSIDRNKRIALLTRRYLGNMFGPTYSQEFPLVKIRRPLPTTQWD